MSDGLNRVILLGHLGTDPDLKYGANGQAVLKLRIATNESWFDKEKGERREKTEWHDVTVFGPRGEALAKILSKGSGVLVEGGLRTSSYDKDGVTRYRTEVIAREICFAGGASRTGVQAELRPSSGAAPARRNGAPKPATDQLPMEDIPF